MANPLVTVAVSTYCGADLIRACLEDLQAQTIGRDLEIVVVDSGSPQDERAVALELQQMYSNITYLRTERETLYQAWNRALERAHGTYFANVNVDDWLRSDALELFARALDTHRSADLAYSHWATTHVPRGVPPTLTTDGHAVHEPYVPALPLFYCYSGCVQFWRRSSLIDLGGYDSSLTACGDLDALVRLTASGGSAVLVPALLQGYYLNPHGISKASDRSILEQRAILSLARATIPIALLYDVNDATPEALAAAWTHLGNMAFQVRVPWHAGPLRDVPFAVQCYERALDEVADYVPALHNRYVVLRLFGSDIDAEAGLASLTLEQAQLIRRTDLQLINLRAVPRHVGLVFEPDDLRPTQNGVV